jgi:hypothetical protein
MGTHVPNGKVILPLHLAGNAHWFSVLLKAGNNAVIDLHERFEKQSPRSRFHLLGPNGTLCVVFPLQHGEVRKQSTGHQVLFDEMSNKRMTWRTIKSCLGSSPYFIHYEDELHSIFEKEHTHLAAFSLEVLHFCLRAMNLPASFAISDEAIILDEQSLDYRKQNLDAVVEKREPYIQVFSDRFAFVPNLSILDLLFNMGPSSADYLKRIQLV